MTLTVQLSTMLSMVGMGMWLGASIDTYGRFTTERRSFHWLTAINDFLFWLVQGLIVFFVLLHVNQGEMRFYIVIALLCGFAAYRALLQRHFQVFLNKMIEVSISTYRFFRAVFLTLIYHPIKSLLKLLYTLCMMVITSLISIIIFLAKVLYIPLRWTALLLYKLLRLRKLVEAVKRNKYIRKAKEVIQLLLKRNNRGDD